MGSTLMAGAFYTLVSTAPNGAPVVLFEDLCTSKPRHGVFVMGDADDIGAIMLSVYSMKFEVP